MGTNFRKRSVIVELAVHEDGISENDLRWAVETALTSYRTLDAVLRLRASTRLRLGKLCVKSAVKVKAKEESRQ